MNENKVYPNFFLDSGDRSSLNTRHGGKRERRKKGKKKANSKWEFLPKAVILLVFDK